MINKDLQNKTTQKNFRPKGFCFEKFCYRYIAGSNSLRGSRAVSRKRLALSGSGIQSSDLEAYQLHVQIEKFDYAVKQLAACNKITLKDLCAVNKIVASDTPGAGKVRRHQNWVGPSLSKAVYVPPKPDEIEALLERLTVSLNADSEESLHKICYCHSNFLMIHPFTDGNGRCSRVLLHALDMHRKEWKISPFIYRFLAGEDRYIAATRAFGVDNNHGIDNPFWSDSIAWGKNKISEIEDVLYRTQLEISQKTLLVNLGTGLSKIIEIAWSNPIFNFEKLSTHFKSNQENLIAILKHLIETGLISQKKIKHHETEVIYEFKPIMDCYFEIESIMIGNGNYDK